MRINQPPQFLWRSSADFTQSTGIEIVSLQEAKYRKYGEVTTFTKHGKHKNRTIIAPSAPYKTLLATLDRHFKEYKLPDYFFGSRRGVSVVDCCKVHQESNYLLKIDLKKFFPNTSWHRVLKVMCRFTTDPELASLLTEVCTYNYQLPQGFPSSSTIAENVLLPLGQRLKGIANTYGLRLSVYIDDICISADYDFSKLHRKVLGIFKEYGLKINYEKTKPFSMQNGLDLFGMHITKGKLSVTPEAIRRAEDMVLLYRLRTEGTKTRTEIKFNSKLRQSICGHIGWMRQFDRESARRIAHQLTLSEKSQ